MRFTSKPAKKEGFYWLKDFHGYLFPAQCLDTCLQDWSTIRHCETISWELLIYDGFMRSVKELKPDD